jgi:putative (di)nucleoside polyphosphate hydrolase
MADPTPDSGALRPNVCAVLTDDGRARVLVFRRADVALGPHCWQFPQGGMKAGETPEQALQRELHEEIGTDAVEVLARLPRPIDYLYPPDVLQRLRRESRKLARYVGQRQVWFLARLREGTQAIRFDHQPAEFTAFEWVTPAEAVQRVVPFKQDAYRRALADFGLLPGAPAGPGNA